MLRIRTWQRQRYDEFAIEVKESNATPNQITDGPGRYAVKIGDLVRDARQDTHLDVEHCVFGDVTAYLDRRV
jgi:hypothetical protein